MKTPVSDQSHTSEYWLGAGVIFFHYNDLNFISVLAYSIVFIPNLKISHGLNFEYQRLGRACDILVIINEYIQYNQFYVFVDEILELWRCIR